MNSCDFLFAFLKAFVSNFAVEIEKTILFDATPLSYSQSVELFRESIWRSLEQISIEHALYAWLETISNPRTKKAYAISFKELIRIGLIAKSTNLQQFSLTDSNTIIDKIKTIPLYTPESPHSPARPWAEATRQQRAAAFLSFTGFLHRRTQGLIAKAVPSKEGLTRTFFSIRQRVKTPVFNERSDWTLFFNELSKINPRDCLIAKIMLQGGKRISEALCLTAEMIDFSKGEITFTQSKTRGMQQITVISFRTEILNELKDYLGQRTGIVFITRKGTPVLPSQIERNFKKAGKRARIPFNVTPHVLRATTVTHLKKHGFSDSDIMKITGHSSSSMIRMYDKSSLADNATKKINLV